MIGDRRRPLTAGVLSLLVPGLGLLYLGEKRAALINFLLVNVALILLVVCWADPQVIEYVHYPLLGAAVLSAGYAHGVATTKLHSDGAVPPNGQESLTAS